MLERLNYNDLLQQPELILRADENVLHSWVEQFPYAPIFKVILAAKYQSIQHPNTALMIEEAAFYVQDRKQLKNLLRKWSELLSDIHSQEAISSSSESTPTISEEIIEESIDSEIISEEISSIEKDLQEVDDKEHLSASEEQALSELIQSGTQTSEITEPSTIEEEILTEVESSENSTVETIEETKVEFNELSESEESSETKINNTEEILSVTATPLEIEIAVEETIEEEQDEEALSEEDDIEFLKSIGKYEIVTSTESSLEEWELTAPGNELPIIDVESIIDTGLVDVNMEWLQPWMDEIDFEYVKMEFKNSTSSQIVTLPQVEKSLDLTSKVEEIKDEKPDKSSTVVANAHSFDEWLSILEQKKNNVDEAPVFDLPSPEVFSKEEIQSEALKNEMQQIESPAPKSDSEGSVKIQAADSVSFKKDMATETLAKLYVRQGKNELAIGIYKQLMNKFPEKSSYFADQINLLK